MANLIRLGNLVLVDVAGTGDLVEYDREGGFVQRIAPAPGGLEFPPVHRLEPALAAAVSDPCRSRPLADVKSQIALATKTT